MNTTWICNRVALPLGIRYTSSTTRTLHNTVVNHHMVSFGVTIPQSRCPPESRLGPYQCRKITMNHLHDAFETMAVYRRFDTFSMTFTRVSYANRCLIICLFAMGTLFSALFCLHFLVVKGRTVARALE
jgi:hypothetical protein